MTNECEVGAASDVGNGGLYEDNYSDDAGDDGAAAYEGEDAVPDALIPVEEDGLGTEVVYLREYVAVWPTSRQRIPGRLSLIKQCGVLFVAWLPYGHSAGAGRPRGRKSPTAAEATQHTGRSRYAVHPMPLSELRALRCRPSLMLLRAASVVLVRQDGLSLPPLLFHAGGLPELIKCLKKHLLHLARCTWDPSVYLVNDTADPLPRTLHPSGLVEAAIGAQPGELTGAGSSSPLSPLPAIPAANGSPRPRQPSASAKDADEVEKEVHAVQPPGGGGTLRYGSGGMDMASPGKNHTSGGSASYPLCPDERGSVQMEPPAGKQVLVSSVPVGRKLSVRRDGAIPTSGAASGGGGEQAEWPEHLLASWQAQGWSHWLDSVQRKLVSAASVAVSLAVADGLPWQGVMLEQEAALMYGTALAMEVPGALGAAEAAAQARIMERAGGDRIADSTDDVDAATAGGGVEVDDAEGSQDETSGRDLRPTLDDGDAGGSSSNSGGSSLGSQDDFEMVDMGVGIPASLLPGSCVRVKGPPLSADEWEAMMDEDGRLVDLPSLRERVYSSGVAADVRREVWKFLLGLYPPCSTRVERKVLMARLRSEYQALCVQWESISPAQAARFDGWRERRNHISKDARRTDRHLPFYAAEKGANVRSLRRILTTYAMYNFNLGYCQGMSDLASPLLFVMRDEAEAFWCFASLMERMGGCFDERQSAVQAQLKALGSLMQVLDPPLHSHMESLDALGYFFAFRWMLVSFKRELGSMGEVLRLWEASWACPFTQHMNVYLAAAVLVHHRRTLMEQGGDLDELLRLCCKMTGNLQLEPLMVLAEQLAGCAARAGMEVATSEGMPPPPPLSVEASPAAQVLEQAH